jgi:hypothetical protein
VRGHGRPGRRGALEVLALYAAGILAYGLVVNFFYQILSHRAMWARREGEQVVHTPARTLAYLVLFPLVSFAFFLILAESLLFMSAPGRDPMLTFTLSMAIVLAVRVAACFNEPTSHDLAKLLPLGVLGVFLVTGAVSDLETSLQQMLVIRDYWNIIAAFFGVVVATEFLLRGYRAIILSMRAKRGKPPQPPNGRGAPDQR